MKKKFLSVLLALTMVLSLLPVSALAVEYSDVSDAAWAAEAIDRWSSYGVVRGADGQFRPNANMTRAEAATVFTNLLGLKSTEGAASFADVSADKWYYGAIQKANAAGIINGSDGYMNPDSPVTREMFFTMFARAMGFKPQDTTSGAKADGASWSAGYINALTDKGYVKGDGTGVNALGNITRAQVMSLLDQTISTYANENGKTYEGTGKGVMLVTADDCTITGSIDTLVIAGGEDEAEAIAAAVNADGSITSNLVLAAGKRSIKIENATISNVNVVAPAAVSIGSGATIETVAVTEQAKEVAVEVAEGAKVETVETEAPATEISGSGEVANVAATGAAAAEDAKVEVSTPNTEVKAVATAENADGSKTVTITESKNDNAGKSTGATKTETTVKETVAADGVKTTETKVTETKTNAAGTVTGTTTTEVKAEEKADGSKVETATQSVTNAAGQTTTTSGTVSTSATGAVTKSGSDMTAAIASASTATAAAEAATGETLTTDTTPTTPSDTTPTTPTTPSSGTTSAAAAIIGGSTDTGTANVTGVTVSPKTPVLVVGETVTLTATVTPNDAANKNVTWTSSDTTVATISSAGVVTVLKSGSPVTFTATSVDTANGTLSDSTTSVSPSARVPVTGINDISPSSLTLAVGGTGNLTTSVTGSNTPTNQTINWSSSDPSVATVSATGTVTGVKAGTVTITAASAELPTAKKTATVTVSANASVTKAVASVSLDKTEVSAKVGDEKVQLTATIAPSDATNKKITWSNGSADSVATVDTTGLVTIVGAGTATITATTEDGAKVANCVFTITKPVTEVALAKSSNPSGDFSTTTIVEGDKALKVPATASSTANDLTLVATLTSGASNLNITVESSNTNVVTVSKGASSSNATKVIIHPVGKGSATVTVASASETDVKATLAVTVTQPVTSVTLNKTSLTLEFDESADTQATETLTATAAPANAEDLTVKWSSGNTSVVTVGESTGVVTVVGVGQTTITATSQDGDKNVTGTCAVNVVKKGATSIANAVFGEINAVTYKNAAYTPVPTVTVGGKTLTKDTDYTLSYSNNVNAGTATITATGIGDYTGTASTTFTINKFDLKDATIDAISNQTYTGNAITLAKGSALVVKNGSDALAASDYTATYANNVNVGSNTATVTLAPAGGNVVDTGSTAKSAKFSIVAANLSSATVEAIPDQTYTGEAIVPTVVVKLGDKTLTAGTDYTVSGSSNTSAGAATLTISPAENNSNLSGSTTKNFNIVARPIAASDVVVTANLTYSGSELTPTIEVFDTSNHTGSGLTQSENYEVTYLGDKTAAGTQSVRITMKDGKNLSGSVDVSYTIKQASVASKEAAISEEAALTYTGSAIEPTVTISGLNKGTDFTVAYSNNVNAGTATATITGKGNYVGTKTVEFTIEKKALTDESIVVAPIDAQTSATAQPAVTVTDTARGVDLVKDTDYTVVYTNNESAISVAITGKGNYSNSKTVSVDVAEADQLKTVTFNYNDGGATASTSVKVKSGEKVAKPADPTREGYEFKGWFAESAETDYFTEEQATVTADITLTAKWAEQVTVTYVFDDGATENKVVTLDKGASVTSTETISATKTGYTNDNKWYVVASADAAVAANATEFTSSTKVDANTIVKLKWTAHTYAIAFNANAPANSSATGEMANIAGVKYGEAKKLTKNAFAIPGYAFAGWATATDGAVAYADEQEVNSLTSSEETVTLYAKWEKNANTVANGETLTIAKEAGDGVEALSSYAGKTITVVDGGTIVFDLGTEGDAEAFAASIGKGKSGSVVIEEGGKLSVKVGDNSSVAIGKESNVTTGWVLGSHAKATVTLSRAANAGETTLGGETVKYFRKDDTSVGAEYNTMDEKHLTMAEAGTLDTTSGMKIDFGVMDGAGSAAVSTKGPVSTTIGATGKEIFASVVIDSGVTLTLGAASSSAKLNYSTSGEMSGWTSQNAKPEIDYSLYLSKTARYKNDHDLTYTSTLTVNGSIVVPAGAKLIIDDSYQVTGANKIANSGTVDLHATTSEWYPDHATLLKPYFVTRLTKLKGYGDAITGNGTLNYTFVARTWGDGEVSGNQLQTKTAAKVGYFLTSEGDVWEAPQNNG